MYTPPDRLQGSEISIVLSKYYTITTDFRMYLLHPQFSVLVVRGQVTWFL